LCVGIITKSSIVRNSEGVEEVRFFSIQWYKCFSIILEFN
jgi:hypothetical protein